MAYYDPYNTYGYDANDSTYYDTVYDEPPPEPSPDWVDVPKANRKYVRKIPREVVDEGFAHLNVEAFFDVEAKVEYVEVNDDWLIDQESGEKTKSEMVATLKVMNLPEIVLPTKKSPEESDSVRKSVTSRDAGTASISEYIRRVLSHCGKTAEKVENVETKEEVNDDAEGGGEMEGLEKTVNPKGKQDEKSQEETPKRTRADIMEGITTLLLSTGLVMVQKLQKLDVRVTVGLKSTSDEGVLPLGVATVRFPHNFHQAILQRSASKMTLSVPVVEAEGYAIGEVGLTVTLVCLGQGVEVGMSEGPTYNKVRFIESFPEEATARELDPPVHPRLAVTIMNLEAPPGLNRTSSEILKMCGSQTPEDAEAQRSIRPKKCRWLEIAGEVIREKESRVSVPSFLSDTSSYDSIILENLPILSGLPRDPELDLAWKKMRREIKELNVEEILKNKMKPLYDELDELLRQDKVDDADDMKSDKTISTKRSTKSSGKSSFVTLPSE